VVLALAPGQTGLHGVAEQLAFERLGSCAASSDRTEDLCRLVLLGMLPALAERDLEGFGEALHEFNVRIGEAFAPVQGGTYASPAVAELVAFLRGHGLRGVGQSSWGPAVFGIVGDEIRAAGLGAQLRARFGLQEGQVHVTSPCNEGAASEWP
jgi:predicted sugar kinase